jgi:protein-disulfide isomerase
MAIIGDFMKKLSLFVLSLALSACATTPAQLEKMLVDNPDILVKAMEKHPAKFAMALSQLSEKASEEMRAEEERQLKAKMEEEFKNPLKPVLAADRAVQGPKDAPITIVEYTDFECPYCRRGHAVIEQVKKAYPGKIRLVYKSLPLPIHPMAMPAARRFEAIALQDQKKAFAYHDLVFTHQDKLEAQGEKFLDQAAKQAGANIARMKKDMQSKTVLGRIEGDMEEAEKFDITGTPGFVINGVSLKGAYPLGAFKEIIDRHLAAKK